MPGVGFLIGGVIVALGSPRTAYAVAGAGVIAAGARRRAACGRAYARGAGPSVGAQTSTTTGSTIGRRLSRS